MSDGTLIEWTDATWNPIVGCKVISPGCTNCYAMFLAGTRLSSHPSRKGLTLRSVGPNGKGSRPVWTGRVKVREREMEAPLKWRKPRHIFVCAHSDLFYEGVEEGIIDRVFEVMEKCGQHTFQLLTKRSAAMHDYLVRRQQAGHPILKNVWIGVSVENQATADERIKDLLRSPAACRFISAEPLLSEITIHHDRLVGLDWMIVGGEKTAASRARPCHPAWVESLYIQAQSAKIPFFFKQWGTWSPVADGQTKPGERAILVGKDGATVDRHSSDKSQGKILMGNAKRPALIDGHEVKEMPFTPTETVFPIAANLR